MLSPGRPCLLGSPELGAHSQVLSGVIRSPCCVGMESALEKAPLLSWPYVLLNSLKISTGWFLASDSTKQMGASGP